MYLEFVSLIIDGLSILAFIISIIAVKKKGSSSTKTYDEILETGGALMKAYVEKQCKKNKININSPTEEKKE